MLRCRARLSRRELYSDNFLYRRQKFSWQMLFHTPILIRVYSGEGAEVDNKDKIGRTAR